MPIVTLKEILKDADRNKYGIGMFDVHNFEMVNAAIAAAEEESSPLIIALAEAHAHTVKETEAISNLMVFGAKKAKVPVAVHLDHASNLDNIIRVMHLGFSSVMYDGSTLPYKENVQHSAEAVRFAKIFGASVEAELGHVGGAEGGGDDGHQVQYTEPNEAARFVEETGVDALAVSIGTSHGVYKEKPRLDIERLRAIKARTPVPLVLHGGSGLTDQDFRNCILGGISKVNIYTEIVQVAMNRISCEVNTPYSKGCIACSSPRQKTKDELIMKVTEMVVRELGEGSGGMNYPDLMERSVDGMKRAISAKLRLFGSSGKA